MRILWFNFNAPSRYNSCTSGVLGGWQDSLQSIVMKYTQIELVIAFKGKGEVKNIDGVTYVPIDINFNSGEKLKNFFTWDVEAEKLVAEAKKVVKQYKPDVIQVFGTEWPFGLIARETNIPVVVHIQGALIPIYNAQYPPKYNGATYVAAMKGNLLRYVLHWSQCMKNETREQMEKRTWECVSNYMGRTDWDYAISNVFHPGRRYFHVDEALREAFIETDKKWSYQIDKKIKIVTVGCSTLYKGIDVILKIASILKKLNVDFEWNVVGKMPNEFRMMVEYKEKKKIKANNVNLLGILYPDKMIDLLCNSTIYVHTAYIENSPNSICEAQILGVPVISTNVGGISTLVRDKIDGLLFPANDPYQMANAIVSIAYDKEKLMMFSENSRTHAMERHNPEKIAIELINCYKKLVNK